MLAPTQTKKTARIGNAPVNSAPVNEPKNFGIAGKNVAMIAPVSSGTTIMPPGTLSMARRIGSWIILPSPNGARSVRAMNKYTRLMFATALLAASMAGTSAHAAKADCKLKFTISGWSAFYKRSDGSGTITCTNGQSMKVRLRARGGGPSVGKSTINNGTGEFSGVDDIRQLLGTYASAEAEAGAVKSAKAHIVTKGEVSLALSGTGEGWEIGVAFGKFQILRR